MGYYYKAIAILNVFELTEKEAIELKEKSDRLKIVCQQEKNNVESIISEKISQISEDFGAVSWYVKKRFGDLMQKL